MILLKPAVKGRKMLFYTDLEVDLEQFECYR